MRGPDETGGGQDTSPDFREFWGALRVPAMQATHRRRLPSMTMNRVRVTWTNFPGAPGYSNFYVGTTITDHTPIRTFFNALITYLPASVQINIPTNGDQISEATGLITGAYSATVTGGVVQATAANTGAYSGASGAQVQWQTSAIVNGRRPLGKTFIVPGYGTMFDATGSLSSGFMSALATAGTNLIAALSGELKVWSRPTPSIAGSNVTVTSCRVPDLAVTLRSRRT